MQTGETNQPFIPFQSIVNASIPNNGNTIPVTCDCHHLQTSLFRKVPTGTPHTNNSIKTPQSPESMIGLM
jgi:hypothetical protein